MAEITDAVSAFFKAIGERQPEGEIATAAREALRELAAQRIQLKRQSELIQEVAAHYGGIPVADLAEDADGGLSAEQKAAINGILDETLAAKPATTVEEAVDLIRARTAIPLTELVEKPSSVIASMMAHAKKRIEKAATPANGASATPAPATTATTPAQQPVAPAA